MVPNGWSLIKLKDIGKCITGLTYSPKNVVDKGLLVLRSSNVQDSKLSFNDNVYVDLEVDNESKTRLGDILLCVRNGSKNLIGKSAFIDKGSEQLAHGAFMSLFRSNETPDYSFQLFQSSKFFRQVNQNLGATINSINSGNLYQFKFAYPPFEERKKIAKILSTWDKAIGTTERLIDNSKQQKKALMQQLITGKKRLLDDSGKPFRGEFDRVNLSELAIIDKSSLGKKTPEDFEFSYISLSDVETGKIADNLEKYVFSSSPSRARRKLSNGDILLATVRPNLKGFAKVKADHDGMIASTGFSVLTPKKGVSGDYLYHYLFSCHLTGQINALVVGSNYPAINSSDVSGLKVYIPSYDEQKKVACVLNNADQSLSQLEQQLADLKQEKKALMQQLLTGKRRVNVMQKDVS
tara:strand:- start:2136 stop:3359 length:1224 start_codon:yes stop_codon:yes gene_type:complete